MAWESVFGELWFWLAASLVWARAALSLFGATRRLMAEALRSADPAPALFVRDLARYRLGPGDPTPRLLAPIKLPLLGGLAAYGAASGFAGDALGPALLCVIGPIAASTLFIEDRVRRALAEIAAEGDAPDAQARAFADVFEQSWRLRLAATLAAVLLTIAVAALTKP